MKAIGIPFEMMVFFLSSGVSALAIRTAPVVAPAVIVHKSDGAVPQIISLNLGINFSPVFNLIWLNSLTAVFNSSDQLGLISIVCLLLAITSSIRSLKPV